MAINIHVVGSSIFFYIFLLIIFPMVTTSSLISESEALLKLRASFANAIALDFSWQPGTEPCAEHQNWIGVICVNGVVFGLRLGHMGLSGRIDIDALLSLPGLRTIAFMSNAFSGPIPDFHRMETLKGLYLSNNQFSGDIPPDYFVRMNGLKKVWLSGNRFSGPIPSSLSKLPHLMELHLEDNQFSGLIPPFQQPSLVSLNLSNNNLGGEIPPSMLRYTPNVFVGNPGLCGGNSGRMCVHHPDDDPLIKTSSDALDHQTVNKHSRSHNNTMIVVYTSVAAAVVFLLMVAGIVVLKRRQENSDFSVDDSPSFNRSVRGVGSGRDRFGSGHRVGLSGKGSTRKFGKRVEDIVMINDEKGEFCLADLMKATAEVLGNGCLGSSYKAILDTGLSVVVKRIKEMTKMGKDQFDSEMTRFGSLKHKNVLTPLAYYYRIDEKLLVHEYQPKGSLLFLLHGDRGVSHAELTWPVRFRIIQGIVRGLSYLHTEFSSLILPHGDLKSSNILLTAENEPLLSDYGFYYLMNGSEHQAAQALSAYKSPEAISHLQISPKCDIFCLGVIILEILTGKFPSHYLTNGEGGIDLTQWARFAIDEGKEAEFFDPDIVTDKKCIDEMTQVLHIGVACTESDPEQRLDIREALRRVEDLAVLGGNSKEATTVQIVSSSEI